VARRLLATYLTITALTLAVVVVPLGRIFADREHDRLTFDIERDAQAVASLVEDALEAGTDPAIDATLADYRGTGGRVVVVDRQGISVADSDNVGGPARDFSTRPEIASALDGRRATGTRPSERAITAAAAASLTILAGAAGIAVNSGIVGARGDDHVGRLTPLGTTAQPVGASVADPATTTPTAVTATPPVQASDSQPVATSSASGSHDGDEHDDDEHDGDEHDGDEHDGDEHEDDDHREYEGADDDD
jgi:hypothetical protein